MTGDGDGAPRYRLSVATGIICLRDLSFDAIQGCARRCADGADGNLAK